MKSRKIIKVHFEVESIRPGGGAPGYIYNLIKGINKYDNNNINFLDISYSSQEDTKRTHSAIKIENNRINLLKAKIRKNTPNFLKTVKLLLSKKWKELLDKDIIVFQGFQSYIVAQSISIFTNKIIIYMPHCPTIAADEIKMNNTLYNLKHSPKDYLINVEIERKLFKYSNLIVFASKGASKEYFKNFNNELAFKDVRYIESGIDLPDYERKEINEIRGFSVLFAGRYVSHKGYNLFCEAAETLNKTNNKINFYSIGGGPILPNKYVHDLGWQENPYNYIKKVSVIVVPNEVAYYDLLPLECSALGKPIILTKVGGNLDQLKKLPDTLGCQNNKESLSNAILSAYSIISENNNWGINNLNAYNEYFDAKHLAERWIDLFLNLDTEL